MRSCNPFASLHISWCNLGAPLAPPTGCGFHPAPYATLIFHTLHGSQYFHVDWCPLTWYVWVEHALRMRSVVWLLYDGWEKSAWSFKGEVVKPGMIEMEMEMETEMEWKFTRHSRSQCRTSAFGSCSTFWILLPFWINDSTWTLNSCHYKGSPPDAPSLLQSSDPREPL